MNQKKIFRVKDIQNSIACQKSYGPKFGSNHAIEIGDNCLSKDARNISVKNSSYGDNLGLTEDVNFSLDEVEVLLIEYN